MEAPNWRTSRAGNPYAKIAGFTVVVFRCKDAPGAWRFLVTDSHDLKDFSDVTFDSLADAKHDALGHVATLRGEPRP